jgi:hypothetical protein
MKEEKVRLFSDVQAIQSERASDFDVYSAYGEVLDNSIEAESKNVRLKFSTSIDKSRGRNFLHIKSLAFGDDGIGMSSEILHRCLQLGYSSRYGSRKGIGRFGVGMTKGAISQCKRIDIYSKELKSKKWLYTYFDIDEITLKGAFINEPIEKEIPNEFKDLMDSSSGTLVIWSKFDRQDKSANEIVNESKIWIGRTFRKFIFEGRKFYIDGQEVKAVDPLYLNPKFTAFPNDPIAEKWGEDDVFEWEIDDPDLADKVSTKKSKIIIRHSWLPKEFLSKGGGRTKAGDHPDNKERCIDRNEGISILRNNREVRDPEYDIPFWAPKFEAIDRWWGCEISFSSELDNWFQVKNIKRGAAPLKELREELQKRINSVRKSIKTKTQEYWDSINTPQLAPRGMEVDPNHGKSTKIATETIADTKPKDKLSKNKKLDVEIEKFVASRYKNLTADKINGFYEYFRNNHITIHESPSNSANFFEITHFGSGKSNITYNTNHIFCTKYFQILSELKALNANQNSNQNDILVLIDLLLIAYSLAESQFDPEANFKAEDFFEDMMRNWGKSLRDLLKKWNEYESNS